MKMPPGYVSMKAPSQVQRQADRPCNACSEAHDERAWGCTTLSGGSAVAMGRKDRMDLAIGIAVGSSIQISLFVAPVLVLMSLVMAPAPFNLAFSRGELLLLFMTVLIGTVVASVGKSNWYKGVQLLTVYLIFSMRMRVRLATA